MKRISIFGILGGFLGFAVHLILDHTSGVSVFSIGPHAIQGTLFSVLGIVVGVLIGMGKRRSK